jgi:hypothetical protein
MDDTYSIKMQVRGAAYRFAPFTEDQIFALQLLDGSNARDVASMLKLLRKNTEPEDWDALWDRLTDRDDALGLEDLSKAFVKLFDKTTAAMKDAHASADDDD